VEIPRKGEKDKERKNCGIQVDHCWGLVLKCYEPRTRQHRMLNVNVLRHSNHYLP
jgi:hypothetical protein